MIGTLTTPVEKVDVADVKIVRDDNHTVIAVKSVAVDTADATKLNIETFVSMTDGKSYTVTYTAQNEAKTESTASFTATNGEIAELKVSPETIPANKATTIKYSAVDANGVVIYEKPISDKATGIDIDVTSDNGYLDNDKLVLMEVGNTAKVTVTYHTYKYDTGGNELGKITKEATITAVDASAAASKFNYTIAEDTPAWENFTQNTKVAYGDNNRKAFFQIKDNNGDDITADCGYTVESSNPNVLIASGDVKDYATLVPVAEGPAYLILKDKDKTVTTLAVTVVAERKLATFTLDKTSVDISTGAAIADPGSASIGFSAKDQYGDDIKVSVSSVNKTMPSGADTSMVTTGDPSEPVASGMITIATTNAKAGSYTYTVEAKKDNVTITKSYTVNAKSPSNKTMDYMLQFGKGAGSVSGAATVKSVDTTVTKTTATHGAVSVVLVKKNNGVVTGGVVFDNTVSLAAITVKGSDGKTYAASGASISKPVTSAAIDDTTLTNAFALGNTNGLVLNILASKNDGANVYTKNLPVGSYNVTLTVKEIVNGKVVEKPVYGTFKVEDKQPALTVNVLKTDAGSENTVADILVKEEFAKFAYGGVTQKGTDLDITEVYGKKNGKTAVVSKVTVTVKVGDTNKVNITVPVNKVFTTTADNWTNTFK